MKQIYEKIGKRAKELESETAQFLIDLVKIPSFSGKEREVVNAIESKMHEIGFDEVRIDGFGNVIGRIGNGSRIIAFDAHVDTVYPGDLSHCRQ